MPLFERDDLELYWEESGSGYPRWAADMKKNHADLDDATLSAFRRRMDGGDFTFNVSRDFVRALATPLLVLAGNEARPPRS